MDIPRGHLPTPILLEGGQVLSNLINHSPSGASRVCQRSWAGSSFRPQGWGEMGLTALHYSRRLFADQGRYPKPLSFFSLDLLIFEI